MPRGSQRKELERISGKDARRSRAVACRRPLSGTWGLAFARTFPIFAAWRRLLNSFPGFLATFLFVAVAASDAARSLADQPDHSVNIGQLFERATASAIRNESREAVEQADRVIELDADFAPAYYLRGRERFRLGLLEQAVSDFDRYIQLRPESAASQWERGIALYYAGRYREGAEQFAAYQTRYDNDVENSVWRYLCIARQEGLEEAKEDLLPIKNDPRVPMMEIYQMYRGELTPEQVIEAAKKDGPAPKALRGRLFYAHLYIGLFHEVACKADLAKKHILLAADPKNKDAEVNRYMWDVARIHLQRLRTAANKGRTSP